MLMHSFVSPFRKAKFCGVPSRVFDKLGCAAGEKRLRNTDTQNKKYKRNLVEMFIRVFLLLLQGMKTQERGGGR
jgi:hypothetical protein